MKEWFCYSPDDGMEIFETQEEAFKKAEEIKIIEKLSGETPPELEELK